MDDLWVEMRRAWRYNTPVWRMPRRVQVAYLGVGLVLFGVSFLLAGVLF